MAKKIEEIYAELNRYMDRVQDGIDERVASAVGFTVRQRMLEFIAKGISPILNADRFAEYKAVGEARRSKGKATQIGKELRAQKAGRTASAKAGDTSSGISHFTRNIANLEVQRKAAQSAGSSRRGYPYSVQRKFPGKMPRPVNLFLSGAFLNSLTFAIGRANKAMRVTIGFFDAEQAVKERGHREGANGQPKRPIIPKGNEAFNQTIQLDIKKLLRDAIGNALKSAKGP